MNFKTFLTIASITAFFFGLPLIFFPQMMAGQFGVSLDLGGMIFARTAGVMLLGLGVLNWFARNWNDKKALKDLLMADLGIQVMTGILDTLGTTSGLMNQMGWIGVGVHIILGAGFLYFYKKL